MRERRAVIAGAGPAGLTAAYELLERSDVRPVVFEASSAIGGLSQTIRYKGNRMDLGGHRFFSKSDPVMDWWLRVLPLQGLERSDPTIHYRRRARPVASDGSGPDPQRTDDVMLLRERRSRIWFQGQLFDYPLKLTPDTLWKLGPVRTARILASYLRAVAFPLPEERTLEQFFVNRFGRELYETFFRDYTEKVWGRSCSEIGAEWGAQRVKGLSIGAAVRHGLARLWPGRDDVRQRTTETSLVEQFLYPKLGPGQLWESVAETVRRRGGSIHLGRAVIGLESEQGRITAAHVQDADTGRVSRIEADYFLSTMPVPHLLRGMGPAVPEPVLRVAAGLRYRELIAVGLLVQELAIPGVRDNWIYVQEPGFKLGRIQIFDNWSPYMIADARNRFLGLEYFCDAHDPLWSLSDEKLARFASDELVTLGMVEASRVLDHHVVRVEKAYPAYFGSYASFATIRAFVDGFANLFLVGRNGMHRYNNQNHSMLTAMAAVDNIVSGRTDKENLWSVNSEESYLEERS